MANLNVDYASMSSEASSLRNGMNEINEQLNSMRNRINNLVTNGFVTDQASGAFQQLYENFNQGATQTVGALEQIAGTLDNMVSGLQQRDEELARTARM